MYALDDAIAGRSDLIFHLHSFQDQHTVTSPDVFAFLYQDGDDHAGHGASNSSSTLDRARCKVRPARAPKHLVFDHHLVSISLHDDIVVLPAVFHRNLVRGVTQE
jgi:hypothetical protein